MAEELEFNLFNKKGGEEESTNKRDIRVGYIDPDLGYVTNVSRYQANKYAELNPGTQFIVSNRDQVRYLNINEVNELTVEDTIPVAENPICGDESNIAKPDININGSESCNKKTDRLDLSFLGGGGVGAKGNLAIGLDGSILGVDLVEGGFGYKYPPLVQIIDKCNIGKGASAQAFLGETTDTLEITDNFGRKDDFEILDFSYRLDEGINFPDVFGTRYDDFGKPIGDWSPSDYANYSGNPIQIEIQKYQDFISQDLSPWWTTRSNKPDSIITSGGTGKRQLYNVTHWSWGGEILRPEPLTGFVEIPFDLKNLTDSYSRLGLVLKFTAEDNSHQFTLKPKFSEFFDEGDTTKKDKEKISKVELRFIEEDGQYFILATGTGRADAEITFSSEDAPTYGYAFTVEDPDDPFNRTASRPLTIQADDGEISFFKALNSKKKQNTKSGVFTAGERYRIDAPSVFSPIVTKNQISYLDKDGTDANGLLTFNITNQRRLDDPRVSPGVLQYERVLTKKIKANTNYIVRSTKQRFSIKNKDKIIKNGIISKDGSKIKIKGTGLGSIVFTTYVESSSGKEYEDTVVSAGRGAFLARNKTKSGGEVNYDIVYRLDLPNFQTREQILVEDTYMNKYAVSPVPKSEAPKSANVGRTYQMTWSQYFPYSGKYTFKGLSDNVSELTLRKRGELDELFTMDLEKTGELKESIFSSFGRKTSPYGSKKVSVEEGVYDIIVTLTNRGKRSTRTADGDKFIDIWDSKSNKNKAKESRNGNLKDYDLFNINPSNDKKSNFMNTYGVTPIFPSKVKKDKEDAQVTPTLKFIVVDNPQKQVFLKVVGEGKIDAQLKLKADDDPIYKGLAFTQAEIEQDGGEKIILRRGQSGDNGKFNLPDRYYREKDTTIKRGIFRSGKLYEVKILGGNDNSGLKKIDNNKIGIDDNIGSGYDENGSLSIGEFKILEDTEEIITTSKYKGTYNFQWENLNIKESGIYSFAVEADNSVKITITDMIGNAVKEKRFSQEFVVKKEDKTVIKDIEFKKKGQYRIAVELTQIGDVRIKNLNAMKLAIRVTRSFNYRDELELNNQSWNENPMGVALTIDAPTPPIPKVFNEPKNSGRCPNNPLWTTRFRPRNNQRRWYPAYNAYNDGIAGGRNEDPDTDKRLLGYRPAGTNNKLWSSFMNRYAISPVQPSGRESSALVGRNERTSTWEIEVPFDGFYGIQGTFSGKNGKITLTGDPVPNRKFEYKLQDSNYDLPGISKRVGKELNTKLVKLQRRGDNKVEVVVEVDNDTAPGVIVREETIFDSSDWVDEVKDVTGEALEEKILCHAGGGYGGNKNGSQTKVGRVLAGNGGNGGPGQSDEERDGAANGGGAGLKNGRSAQSGKGDTLDGGFGVNFDGNQIGTDDEVRSGGEGLIFANDALSQPNNQGGNGAFHGGGGGGSRGNGKGGAGGGGGVKIRWGSTGKFLEFNKPGTYTAIVPRTSPGRDDRTSAKIVCIGGGGSGHTDKSPPKKVEQLTGTAKVTIPIVTPKEWKTEYGTEYGVEVRNEVQKIDVYKEIRKVSGGGGSGGAYAYQTVKLPAGAVLQIVVGAGGQAQLYGGSQDGEDSYVRVLKTTLAPEFVSIDTRTGKIQSNTSITKKLNDKYDGVIYEGPPIVSYTKGKSASFKGMGPLISPFLAGGVLDTFDINGKVSEFQWRKFNFPETDDYIFEAVADESMEVFIGDATDKDNRIMRVSIEEGIKRVTRRVDKGEKRITLKLTNSNQAGTNYNLNPMFAGFKIKKVKEEIDNTDRRSWRQNPVGVSAVIIPPPCEKKLSGVGIVTDVKITFPGVGYTTPPGDSYPVGIEIIDFEIIDPGINYDDGDPIEIDLGDLGTIEVPPFFPGTVGGGSTTTQGIGTTFTILPPEIKPLEPLNPDPGPPSDPGGPGDPGDPGDSKVPAGPPPPIKIETDPFGRITGISILPEIDNPNVGDGGGGGSGGGGGDGGGDGDGPGTGGGGGVGGGVLEGGGAGDGGGDGGGGGITFPPGIPIPPVTPKIRVRSQTGINAQIRAILRIVRDPLGVPPENIVQVTDLVGLKQTGYIDGRPYYGQVFTINGIKYAGVYRTAGELIQIYDTLQESIERQVTTPPSAIIRQGTDISSNDPRLNIPGTPETIE